MITIEPSYAGSFKIIRPQPAEILEISEGNTFVIGTVNPPNSTVFCNDVRCEVDEDGAFIGFVPIQRTQTNLQIEGKTCDVHFEFIARSNGEKWNENIPTISPLSPSAAKMAEEVFDSLKTIKTTKDQWIGLEEKRLGQLIYIPKGTNLKVKSASTTRYYCEILSQLHNKKHATPIDVSIPTTEAKLIESSEAEPPPFQGFLLIPNEDTTIQILRLGNSPQNFVIDKALHPFGCEILVRGQEILLSHKSELSNHASDLRDLNICLDPGHNPDPGAVGPRGLEERESNLMIALETERLLKAQGAKVSYTHQAEPLELKERHQRIRELKPDLVISIHNNSVGDGQDPRLIRGTQTFYLYPWSKPLAESVHQAILGALNTVDRGCIRRNLYIPRFPECPIILIEPEYLILPDQEKKFINTTYRNQLAGAIVEGIKNFIQQQSTHFKEQEMSEQ